MSRDWTQVPPSERTWWEWTQNAMAFCIALVIALVMIVGGFMVLGMMVDGYTDYKMQHERCLKRATNGYEIERCR